MKEMNHILSFGKLFRYLELGEIRGAVEPLTGGLLHQMFLVATSMGKFAVKVLHPYIMARPQALRNTVNSEKIASVAARAVPAVPAKRFFGESVHKFDGRYYMVFDFINGKPLRQEEITLSHCEKMGGLLGDLHHVDFSEIGLADDNQDEEKPVNWDFYIQKGMESNRAWAGLLKEHGRNIKTYQDRAIHASRYLAKDRIISHRDLDAKNVLWSGGNPVFIDWESAGFIHPAHDLVETALYWSKDETGNISQNLFYAFISGYQNKSPLKAVDWRPVLDKGFSAKLGWLEYSLKRSLGIEYSGDTEIKKGEEQAIITITAAIQFIIFLAAVTP